MSLLFFEYTSATLMVLIESHLQLLCYLCSVSVTISFYAIIYNVFAFSYTFVSMQLAPVIPDVPDLAPDANRSTGARPDDPYVLPKTVVGNVPKIHCIVAKLF